MMEFRVKDARPIWQQLADLITEKIITGEYAPGERIPSVRDLAMQVGVNPNTMQRALSKLEDDGLLITERTSGRTVTDNGDVIDEIRNRIAGERVREYVEDMKKLGFDRAQAAALAAEEKGV